MAFFTTAFRHLPCGRSESLDDFLAELFRRLFGDLAPNEPLPDAAKRLLGDELASFAVQDAAPGESVKLTLGRYLCAELAELILPHLSPVPDDWSGELNVDAFTAMCAIAVDDDLHWALGPFVEAAAEGMARFYKGRRWVGEEYDSYAEDSRENGQEAMAELCVPQFDLGVAKVYDPNSGCYSRPLNLKIVRVELHDGRAAHVALTVVGFGTVLLDRKKLLLKAGAIEGDVEEEEKRKLEQICALLWNNSYFAALDPKRRK